MNSNEAIDLLMSHLQALRIQQDLYLRDPHHTNQESSQMRDVNRDILRAIGDIFTLKNGINAAVRIKKKLEEIDQARAANSRIS